LLLGLDSPDDAAVWRLGDSRLLVVTTDFFTPVVDDPYEYGAIAAANALSDLYAMGATPALALNVAAIPPQLPAAVVGEIFRGGGEKVRQAGAVIAGGHTIQDTEPKYGLVAVGFAREGRLMAKRNARAGDTLVLTKPLGTGVITTALKREAAQATHVQQAVEWMMRLNGDACRLALLAGAQAATDVTGFSLLGHGVEMAQASGVHLRLHLPSIPFMSGAFQYAHQGMFPGGSADNRMYFGAVVEFDVSIDEYSQMLLFDAQTSGGLLIALGRKSLRKFLQAAKKEGFPAWPIGAIEAGEGLSVVDEPFPIQPVGRANPDVRYISPASSAA
jgi:selenide,water dikinase